MEEEGIKGKEKKENINGNKRKRERKTGRGKKKGRKRDRKNKKERNRENKVNLFCLPSINNIRVELYCQVINEGKFSVFRFLRVLSDFLSTLLAKK